MMNDKELTEYTKKLCLKLFGIKYDSYAKFETTTKTTVGRFRSIIERNMWGEVLKRTNHYHIEIQKKFIEKHPDMLEKVVGHELCHYYCYITNKPFADFEDYFQEQLKKRNLPAHIDFTDDPKRYVIYCPKCHNTAIFKTHIKANYTCAYDNIHMERYGFIKLHGCYKANQILPAIKKIIFAHHQKKADKFNVKQYDKVNSEVAKGQQMALFA